MGLARARKRKQHTEAPTTTSWRESTAPVGQGGRGGREGEGKRERGGREGERESKRGGREAVTVRGEVRVMGRREAQTDPYVREKVSGRGRGCVGGRIRWAHAAVRIWLSGKGQVMVREGVAVLRGWEEAELLRLLWGEGEAQWILPCSPTCVGSR